MELSAIEIREMLPHRYPFLLLDSVTEVNPGIHASGYKNVSINEPFFQGHFPKDPILPGVFIIEALAQLTAVMYCCGISSSGEAKKALSEYVGYLAGVNRFRFKGIVRPGDQLMLHAEMMDSHEGISQVSVRAECRQEIVASGVITVSRKTAA